MQVPLERRLGLVVETVLLTLEHQRRDAHQFLDRVVGEVDVVCDARLHPWITLEKRRHAIAVAGEDHDQVVAFVLHRLQEDLDRFLTVIALVLGLVQVVRLIDEEHAAACALEDFFGFGRGMPDELPDEIVARDADDRRFAHVAEAVQNLGHLQRDRRFSGPGRTREAHVQRRLLGLQARASAAAW